MKQMKKTICLLLALALGAGILSLPVSSAAVPETKAEILECYRAAVERVRNGDAGYKEEGTQTVSNLNVTGIETVDYVLSSVAERYLSSSSETYERGSADAKTRLPACVLQDLSAVTDADCLMNGSNYALKLTLTEEENPKTRAHSRLGQISDVFFARDAVDREISNIPLITDADYDLIWSGFTVTAELTPDGQFVSLTHSVDGEIRMNSVKIIVPVTDKSIHFTMRKTYSAFDYGEADAPAAALPGDVSLDGNVSAEDARLTLRLAVGLENYAPGSAQFLAADYDGSGDVTAADARAILRLSVGLSPLDPAEDPGGDTPENPLPQPSAETVALAEKYRAALEKTRALKAGFSTLTWQNVPVLNVTGNATVDGFINSEVANYVHSAERPEGWTYEKNTADAASHFPPFRLTDYSRILSATRGTKDGNETVTLVLAEETDPRGSDSFLGQVTDDILFREDLDAAIAGISVIGANPDYHVTYKNLTLTAEIAPDGTLRRLHHTVEAQIRVNSALLLVVPLQNKLVSMESDIVYYDFTY